MQTSHRMPRKALQVKLFEQHLGSHFCTNSREENLNLQRTLMWTDDCRRRTDTPRLSATIDSCWRRCLTLCEKVAWITTITRQSTRSLSTRVLARRNFTRSRERTRWVRHVGRPCMYKQAYLSVTLLRSPMQGASRIPLAPVSYTHLTLPTTPYV